MNLEFFPQFVRTNYSDLLNLPNEEIQEIGIAFKAYLENVFEGKMDKLEPIWDISPMTVIMGQGQPFKMKGYHPALILHFTEFVKIEAEKFQKENPEEAAKMLKELEDGKEI